MLAHMAYEGLARARLASQACPCLVQDTLWVDPGVLQRDLTNSWAFACSVWWAGPGTKGAAGTG